MCSICLQTTEAVKSKKWEHPLCNFAHSPFSDPHSVQEPFPAIKQRPDSSAKSVIAQSINSHICFPKCLKWEGLQLVWKFAWTCGTWTYFTSVAEKSSAHGVSNKPFLAFHHYIAWWLMSLAGVRWPNCYCYSWLNLNSAVKLECSL
jgi:hypothetical protein